MSSHAAPAPGETSLTNLLRTLVPVLDPHRYVFVALPTGSDIPISLSPRMIFHESEGITLIAEHQCAVSHRLEYSFECRMITLDVHSSLDAVGFIAVVANRLKALGMGVNPVSGYYHDHCFVPVGREEDAMKALRALAEEARAGMNFSQGLG